MEIEINKPIKARREGFEELKERVADSNTNSNPRPKPPRRRLTSSLLKGLLFFFVGIAAFVALGYWYFKSNSAPNIKFIDDLAARIQQRFFVQGEVVTLCFNSNSPVPVQDELSDWFKSLDVEDNVTLKIREYKKKPFDDCDYSVSGSDDDDFDLAWRRYYVLVVSPKSHVTGIREAQLNEALGGQSLELDQDIYTVGYTSDSKSFVEGKYGVGVNVEKVDDPILALIEQPDRMLIMPFEEVTSHFKVLDVDDVSLFTSEDLSSYPLMEEVWIDESDDIGLFDKSKNLLGEINFDQSRVKSIVVTGTSVMGARGLYQKIQETGDPLYPVRDVAPILQAADIAHVSNEASFADDCVQYTGTLTFCGKTESFDAFKYAGIDVIGLTGNHILDAGNENFVKTLDLYDANGIKYFGGGRNAAESRKPAIIDIDGVKFAFLGYNAIPPVSYFATDNSPGSAEMVKSQLVEDIQNAKTQADFVFVDMQWGAEYQREPVSYQLEFGHAAIDAGADFINGVHPHWIQPIERYNDGLIFNSLGNFLFDQMWSTETREGIMVQHFFYGNEYIGYRLIPTMIYEGAQPRVVKGMDAKRIVRYATINL